MQLISIKDLSIESKRALLIELGYSLDSFNFVIDQNGVKINDKYIGKVINASNMLILPGSTIVLDDNPVSLTAYLEEYGDVI